MNKSIRHFVMGSLALTPLATVVMVKGATHERHINPAPPRPAALARPAVLTRPVEIARFQTPEDGEAAEPATLSSHTPVRPRLARPTSRRLVPGSSHSGKEQVEWGDSDDADIVFEPIAPNPAFASPPAPVIAGWDANPHKPADGQPAPGSSPSSPSAPPKPSPPSPATDPLSF